MTVLLAHGCSVAMLRRTWPWRAGVVAKVLKTRIHVRYGDDVWVYDRDHRKFLVDTKRQICKDRRAAGRAGVSTGRARR